MRDRYRVTRVQGLRPFGDAEHYAELDEARAAACSWSAAGYDAEIADARAGDTLEYVPGIAPDLDNPAEK